MVNAANTEKDLEHLSRYLGDYDCTITNVTADYVAVAVQGPKSREMLLTLTGGAEITEPVKNALGTHLLEGHQAYIAKTGYTGEPLGYEVYLKSADGVWFWNRMLELGARAGRPGRPGYLGSLEAGLPLYGHEMGLDPTGEEIPVFAVSLARFAVSFSERKGQLCRPGGTPNTV